MTSDSLFGHTRDKKEKKCTLIKVYVEFGKKCISCTVLLANAGTLSALFYSEDYCEVSYNFFLPKLLCLTPLYGKLYFHRKRIIYTFFIKMLKMV